ERYLFTVNGSHFGIFKWDSSTRLYLIARRFAAPSGAQYAVSIRPFTFENKLFAACVFVAPSGRSFKSEAWVFSVLDSSITRQINPATDSTISSQLPPEPVVGSDRV